MFSLSTQLSNLEHVKGRTHNSCEHPCSNRNSWKHLEIQNFFLTLLFIYFFESHFNSTMCGSSSCRVCRGKWWNEKCWQVYFMINNGHTCHDTNGEHKSVIKSLIPLTSPKKNIRSVRKYKIITKSVMSPIFGRLANGQPTVVNIHQAIRHPQWCTPVTKDTGS